MQSMLFGLLAKKSLRSLECIGLNLSPVYHEEDIAPGSSNLRILKLEQCSIQIQTVCDILGICKRLEKFHLFILKDWTEFPGPNPVDWQALLYKHRSSLKSLALEYDPYNQVRSFTNLLDFNILSKLVIQDTLLIGDLEWRHAKVGTMLPCSISKLRVNTFESPKKIGEILAAFEGWKPTKLDYFKIVFTLPAGQRYPDSNFESWLPPKTDAKAYRGTSFFYTRVLESHGWKRIIFVCTELEVLLNIEKFGKQIVERGLDYLFNATPNDEVISLWEGGPQRRARELFLDEMKYPLDEVNYMSESATVVGKLEESWSTRVWNTSCKLWQMIAG